MQCIGRSCEGSRTPQGVRGLKFATDGVFVGEACRTPQGVRGLKFTVPYTWLEDFGSHPARGAWIEMGFRFARLFSALVAPRKGCVD